MGQIETYCLRLRDIDEKEARCYASPMSQTDQRHWDTRYRAGRGPRPGQASRGLTRYLPAIETLGQALTARSVPPTALDIACGPGGTALELARAGWHVTGVDISHVALAQARHAAAAAELTTRCTFRQVDLDEWRPAPDSTDLITTFYFLERALWPSIQAAVRPGGLYIAETFNRHRLIKMPEANPTFLLQPGELLATVTGWGWEVVYSHVRSPDDSRPTDAVVARKPT